MRYELDGTQISTDSVNVRAVVTLIAGLAIGIVFWSALFLTMAG